MMSFIKKDLLVIKANLKTFLIILVFYIIMGLTMEDGFDMTFILPFISVILFISTFSYDEFNNWNAYSITLPDGRRNAVRGKYLASFLILLITSIIAFISSMGIGVYKETFRLEETLISLFSAIAGMVFVLSIMYPVIFKLGIEKGRILVMGLVFGGSFLIGALGKLIDPSFLADVVTFIDNWYYIVLLFFICTTIGISYLVSIHIYLKKEF